MRRERAILLVLALSVALNVLMAHKLRVLAHTVGRTGASAPLEPGTMVPAFEAVGVDGHKRIVSFNEVSEPTVLYVFTPPCSWCARNADNFKTLIEQKSSEYRFVGVSLSSSKLPEYIANHSLTIPIYTGLSDETKKKYRLGGTPQTIVISTEGRIVKNWIGAYASDQKSQVEAFFHVSLPGLRELPKAEAKVVD